jgi:long-chain fatty acid transport protein
MSFNFDDAISLELPGGNFGTVQDINMDMPDNFGLGLASESLMGGKLLLATDVLYKHWNNTALFGPIYTNQWVFQCGAQYKVSRRVRLRAGYVFAENATEPNPGNSAGGINPGVEAIQYLQAELPNINQHRISAGVGIRDILPGVDMDLFGGGMPRESENYGEFTSGNLESYWVGFGMTWRFGRGACCRLPATDDDFFTLGANCAQSDNCTE